MNEQDLQAIQDGIDAGVVTPEQAELIFHIMAKKAAEEE